MMKFLARNRREDYKGRERRRATNRDQNTQPQAKSPQVLESPDAGRGKERFFLRASIGSDCSVLSSCEQDKRIQSELKAKQGKPSPI
jgi:hypothetical protein